MNVIGISGLAGAGKTAVATYIEETYGVRRQHIATTLRSMLTTMLLARGLDHYTIWTYLEGPLKEQVIPELGITSRQAQITLGTEWGRELVNDNLWVDIWGAIAEREGGDVMNDSVRFPNEEDKIHEMGGFTLLIDRPGTQPAAFSKWWGKTLYRWTGLMWGVHPSERIDLLAPDYTIINDGTLEDLYTTIDEIMEMEGVERLTKLEAAA